MVEATVPGAERRPWDGRVVLHVDMDAFYAAVEQRDEPSYRGKPVVVGGDPKEGRGRGVVSTASYEARRYGIGSAMPISQAYRACPDAIFVRPDMRKYREVSRQVRGVFREFAGRHVEPVSVDEAYLDLTEAVQSGQHVSGEAAGRSLKEAIRRETGLTCSVGVAPSKSVAKIASDFRKPDGLTVVHPDDVVSFLAPLEARHLQGVGPKTADRLRDEGIETIGDLAERSKTWLEERFGKHGPYLWHLANGRDDRPVSPGHGLPKSRSEERTFFRDVQDVTKINRAIRKMAVELVDEMNRKGILFRVIGLKVRNADFETWTRATTLRAPTQRLDPVLRVLRAQLAEFVDGRHRIRLLGVRLAGLERDVGQRTLEDFIADGAPGFDEASAVPAEEGAVTPLHGSDAAHLDGSDAALLDGSEVAPSRLSRFPPWSVPGALVRRPGQQRFDKDYDAGPDDGSDAWSGPTDPEAWPDDDE